LVTLLRLLVEHFAGGTALFTWGDAVEAHVELLTIVRVREHGVRYVLTPAVEGLIFGAREAIFQFHYNTHEKDTNYLTIYTEPQPPPPGSVLGGGGVQNHVVD